MSERSKTIEDFIFLTNSRETPSCMCDRGLQPSNVKRISIADAPEGINFHLYEIIADHRTNLGRLGRCLLT